MVKPTFEDYVIGYMIYLKYHPEFQLDPSNPPPECINTNAFSDGGTADLLYCRMFRCSMSCPIDEDGNIDYSSVNDDTLKPWEYVCSNFETLNTQFPNELRKRHELASKLADSEPTFKGMKGKWQIIKERIEDIQKYCNL